MINIAIAIGVMLVLTLVGSFLNITWWATIPFGAIAGFAAFWFLGRKVQEKLEVIMAQMQKEMPTGQETDRASLNKKLDRAIAVLKTAFAYKNRHILVGAQIHSQIGMLYYIKDDQVKALEHLKQGFMRHYVAQCMLSAIYYKNKDYDAMKKNMDLTIKANRKEAFVYGIYAWFLIQLKETDAALKVLSDGLAKIPNEPRLMTNLSQLQNNKKLKMKLFGEIWTQFMLERPPRIQQAPQHQLPHMRMSRKAMFR